MYKSTRQTEAEITVELTRKLDLFLNDGSLDLVIGVGRDNDVAGSRVNSPAELLDVGRQVVACNQRLAASLRKSTVIAYLGG